MKNPRPYAHNMDFISELDKTLRKNASPEEAMSAAKAFAATTHLASLG